MPIVNSPTPAPVADLRPIPQPAGLAALADRYDGFIVDLWGVLHDGVTAYPGAAECLWRLTRAGKRVMLLSNAPRPARWAALRLAELGFPPDSYLGVMTSGEEAWQSLVGRADPWYRALGRRCYFLGTNRDGGMLDGIDAEVVEAIGDADFVLAAGTPPGAVLAAYEPLLQAAAQRRLPLICANPDLVVITGGRTEICAGTLAARYEALGGPVRYHGKPHASVYRACFARLAPVPPARILAVGDSLRTDVAGAAAVGIDAALVTGGVHAEELGIRWGETADPARLATLCASAPQRPIAALPAFVW